MKCFLRAFAGLIPFDRPSISTHPLLPLKKVNPKKTTYTKEGDNMRGFVLAVSVVLPFFASCGKAMIISFISETPENEKSV